MKSNQSIRSKNINGEILRLLIESKDFVSGESISGKIGISRAAIHKRILFLKDAGVAIESVTKKGHRLLSYPDGIEEFLLTAITDTRVLGREIYSYEQLASTNETLKQMASAQPEGTVVIADCQTEGKGRRGRSFHSARGQGLFFSVLLKPRISPGQAPFITGLAGAALIHTLAEFGIRAQVKWPNDILINGKKVAGILTEMTGDMEQVEYVVLGIGINVNNSHFPEELQEIATSLLLEGHSVSRQRLFGQVMEQLELLYDRFLSGDKKTILEVLRAHSNILGQDIWIHEQDTVQPAVAVDLDENGALLVEIAERGRQTIGSGEVSIRKRS